MTICIYLYQSDYQNNIYLCVIIYIITILHSLNYKPAHYTTRAYKDQIKIAYMIDYQHNIFILKFLTICL